MTLCYSEVNETEIGNPPVARRIVKKLFSYTNQLQAERKEYVVMILTLINYSGRPT